MSDQGPVERRISGKLGVSGFDKSKVPLRVSNYFMTPLLPKVPRTFGHVRGKAPGSGWGMLGNNEYGCCVMAGAAHEHMIWDYATNKPIPPFSAPTIVKQYMALSGGVDAGLDPIQVAVHRQIYGITDDRGAVHKIKAHALIDNLSELEYAIWLYGAAGVCVALPDGAEDTFEKNKVWSDTTQPPDTDRGHYIVGLARNSLGNWVFGTWGTLQGATDAWVHKYMIGGLCYFSTDYLKTTGVSPEGIDEARLDADLAVISDQLGRPPTA